MKITITRSFSRTKQVAAFEPINAFCSASIETDQEGGINSIITDYSGLLDSIVRSEVEKTIDAELAKRKTADHHKIQDSAKAEAEHDAGQHGLDLIIDKEASGGRYKEI